MSTRPTTVLAASPASLNRPTKFSFIERGGYPFVSQLMIDAERGAYGRLRVVPERSTRNRLNLQRLSQRLEHLDDALGLCGGVDEREAQHRFAAPGGRQTEDHAVACHSL